MSENASTSVLDLVTDLERSGIRIWVEEGQLRFRAPAGLMTDDRKATLRARKQEIVTHLSAGGFPLLTADRAARHEPFPITDVQSAYLLGRGRTFVYGGVACHGYGELHYPDLDPAAMTAAWRALIARHDMLRSVVETDGSQHVLPEVADYEIGVLDLRGRPEADFRQGVADVRAGMDHRVFQADRWPLFEAKITQGDSETVMHVSVDFLIADFVSIQILLDELHRLYHRPDEPLPALDVTFRDYLLAERQWIAGGRHDVDKEYWLGRLDELPPGPELPLLSGAAASTGRFRRLETALDAELWAGLRKNAGLYDVSPSGAVLAAFAHVIGSWSRRPAFTLNVTLLNRLPLHPQVPALIGDFTGVELLAVNPVADDTFARHARAVQAQLWQDMDHRSFSGIEVMREITRRKGADSALFPVVFTSAIGLAESAEEAGEVPAGQFGFGISQTPQVVIDCQNMERAGGLATNWDIREGVLPDGVPDDMFAAFEALLHRLATDEQAWQTPPALDLPAAQRARRDLVNATQAPLVRRRLHDGFFETAHRIPDATAVVCGDEALSYGDLSRAARGVADRLASLGCGSGDLVALTLDRGPSQVVAVLGTLLAGAVYVPIDTVQPVARRNEILAGAGVRFALTDGRRTGDAWPADVQVTAVEQVPPAGLDARATGAEPGDLAYIIHTSGSTGTPKGVMITHEAALNTVLDVNSRFGVEAGDRVLGLSQLGFDLSVYDVFGPLSVGGALVVPDPQRRADPSHWADLIARHAVTVWNSVPAQLQMLSGYLAITDTPRLPSLRLAMLSGDWIPVALPDQIRAQLPGLRVVSLGGATEASIWSIYYPIEAVGQDWASIPYGRPLANQTFHVLDARLRDCPDWVTGELYIGGFGVAQGYLHDESRTAERFITHPVTGLRLYRTGDLGRYLPDGDIEFLGREDYQVKIRGYRIELAEIEAALGAHPAVAGCAVLVDGDTPLERRLVGYAEPAAVPAPPADGALPAELAATAAHAGDTEIDGVDTERYLAYAHALDQAALPAMVQALRQGGLFADQDSRHTLAEVVTATGADPRHHRLLRRWLRALTTEGVLAADGGVYRLAADAPQPATGDTWAAITEAAPASEQDLLDYFQASTAQLPALLRGEDDPLKLLFPDGRLDVSQQLYEDALFNRWANRAAAAVVDVLGARRPHRRPLRVLEVGAGGGGTTAAVLAALAGQEIDYLCTDLSPYFTGQAQARFAGVAGMRFAVYDLNADPAEQGLAPNSFDLVIAGDVLHATADVDLVLGRLRTLTAPGGWLVALEMTRDHYQIMTSLELLVRLDEVTGDFADERQGTDLVFLSRESWLGALERAGAHTPVCLPAADSFIGELGMCVLAARFKADRAPLHPDDLDAHLRTRLPDYMVPPVLQILDALPVTDNGKVDRRTLGRRLPRRQAAGAGLAGSEPATDLERRLAAMWGEALNVPVGRDGNLFELGGDSLVAAQLAGRMIEELPEARHLYFDELLRNLLEQATVARLAGWIADAAQAPGETHPEQAQAGPVDLLAPLHQQGAGVPRVFLPDAAGRLSGVDALAAALTPAAPGYGLAGAGLALLPSVERVAAAYAQAVIDADLAQVEVYGQGAMAVLAVEVARTLTERGVLVEGVTLYDGRRPDPAAGPEDIAAAYAALAGPDATPAGAQLHAQAHQALAGFEPAVYAGDLTLVQSSDADPSAVELWEDICLGDLRIVTAGVPAAGLRWADEPAAAAAAAGR